MAELEKSAFSADLEDFLKQYAASSRQSTRSIISNYEAMGQEYLENHKTDSSIISRINSWTKWKLKRCTLEKNLTMIDLEAAKNVVLQQEKAVKAAAKSNALAAKKAALAEIYEKFVSFEAVPIPENFVKPNFDDFLASDLPTRNIIGKNYDELTKLAQCQKNIMLYGPAGTGKTESVIAFSQAINAYLVKVQCRSGMDFSELFYRQTLELVNGQQKISYVAGPVLTALFLANQGKKTVLLLDELNLLDAEHQALIHGLTDDSKFISFQNFNYKLHAEANLWVIGAINYGEQYATQSLNLPLIDRFVFLEFVDLTFKDIFEILEPISDVEEITFVFKFRQKYLQLVEQNTINSKIEFGVRTMKIYSNLRSQFNRKQAVEMALINKIIDKSDKNEVMQIFNDVCSELEAEIKA